MYACMHACIYFTLFIVTKFSIRMLKLRLKQEKRFSHPHYIYNFDHCSPCIKVYDFHHQGSVLENVRNCDLMSASLDHCIYVCKYDEPLKGASSAVPNDFVSVQQRIVDSSQILSTNVSVELKSISDAISTVFDRQCVQKAQISRDVTTTFACLKEKLCNSDPGNFATILDEAEGELQSTIDENKVMVTEEKQLTKWFALKLEKPLNKESYVIRKTFSHSNYCQFGNSILDCEIRFGNFFRQVGSTVVVVSSVICAVPEYEINCCISEFKNLDIHPLKYKLESYASMIKAGTDNAIEVLSQGLLVNKITVYGLLVSIDHAKALPLKYEVNFSIADEGKGMAALFYGDKEIPFTDAFMLMLKCIKM